MSQQPNITVLSVPAGSRNDAAFVSATTTASGVFVFRPGATLPGGGPVSQNVYTSPNTGTDGLVLLQATLAGAGLFPSVPLASSTIVFDFSLVFDSYDLIDNFDPGQGSTWVGLIDDTTGTVPELGCNGFAVLTPPVEIRDMTVFGGRDPFFVTPPTSLVLSGRTTLLTGNTGEPFYVAPASGEGTLTLKDQASVGGSGFVIVECDANPFTVYVGSGATLFDGAVTGSAVTIYAEPGATIGATYYGVATLIQAPFVNQVVTFQPGGNDGPNVFTDFGQLCFALAASGTRAATILVDASLAADAGSAVVPAGTYALPATVYFEGLYDANDLQAPQLILADAAVFDPPPSVLGIAFMDLETQQATSEVMRVPNDATLTLILRDVQIGASGTDPLVYSPNGGQCLATLYGASVVANSGTPVLQADISGIVSIVACDASLVESGAVDNSGASGIVQITATSNANIEAGNYQAQQGGANFTINYPNGNAPPGSTSQVQFPGLTGYFSSVEAALTALSTSQANYYSEILLTDDVTMGTENEEFGPPVDSAIYALRGAPGGAPDSPSHQLASSSNPLSSWISGPLVISDLEIVNPTTSTKPFITLNADARTQLTRVTLTSLETAEAAPLTTTTDTGVTFWLDCEEVNFATERALHVVTTVGTVNIAMSAGSFVPNAIVNDDAGLTLNLTLSNGCALAAGLVSGTQPATLAITILDPTVTIDQSYYETASVTVVNVWLDPYAVTSTWIPSGTPDGQSRFTDFAAAVGYLASATGGTVQGTLCVDGSQVGSSTSVDAGTYALPPSMTWEGLQDPINGFVEIVLADGAVFDPPPVEQTWRNVYQFSTLADVSNPPFIYDGEAFVNWFLNNGQMFASGPNSLCALLNGAGLSMEMRGASDLFQESGPIFAVDETSSLFVALYDQSVVDAGLVTVAMGAQVRFDVTGNDVFLDQSYYVSPYVLFLNTTFTGAIVTYDTNGSSTLGTVFSVWAVFVGYLNAESPFAQATILVNGDAIIPSGTWALPAMTTFRAGTPAGDANLATLTLAADAVLDFSGGDNGIIARLAFEGFGAITVDNVATAPITIDGTTGTINATIDVDMNGPILPNGGTPFINVTNGGVLQLNTRSTTHLEAGEDDPVVAFDAASSGTLTFYDATNVQDASITFPGGGAGVVTTIFYAGVTTPTTYLGAPYTPVIQEAAPLISYTPGDPTKWAGSPKTLQEAVDRLAAVVGTPTPIP